MPRNDEPLSLDDSDRPVSEATRRAAALAVRPLSFDEMRRAVRAGVLDALWILLLVLFGLLIAWFILGAMFTTSR